MKALLRCGRQWALMAAVAGLLAVGAGTVRATTIYVSTSGSDASDGLTWPTAKATVQAGLDAAAAGDEVWVAAGTYVGCITLKAEVALYGGFAGGEADLSQRDWVANQAILDAQTSGSVVTISVGATQATRIDGFTIRNGNGTKGSSWTNGGGIYCWNSTVTIANNTITDNFVSGVGGGIYCYVGSPTITGNTITNNRTTNFDGAGIYCNSPATITNNTIRGNQANDKGGGIYCKTIAATIEGNLVAENTAGNYGGGIYCDSCPASIASNTVSGNAGVSGGGGVYCYMDPPTISGNAITGNRTNNSGGGVYCSYSSPTIANNTISGNTAVVGVDGAGGAGIYCKQSSPTITSNTIAGNAGSGIYCFSSSSPTIANNAITGNASYPGGGGICCKQSSPTVTNNTIAGNSAPSGGGIYCDSASPTITNSIIACNSSGIYKKTGTPTLRYNCVYGNGAYDYRGVADPTGTNGNVATDPRLGDPSYGRWHIQPDSPCRDAGDDAAIQAGWTDVDGQARKQGAHVDIGADESDGALWPTGPAAIVRVRTDGDDANDGSSWDLPKLTVQAAINAAAAVGGEVWVAGGTYAERITLPNYVHVYGGFAGTEADRSERDWSTHVTVLDGNRGGSVVTATQPGYAVNTIDGFTIRNGRATHGGGIYCSNASPTIANSTITGNAAYSSGGGIRCRASCSTIVNNTITDNAAYQQGGGICAYGSSPMVVNNTIAGNRQTDSFYSGGGVYCGYWSCPVILNNRIMGNTAYYGGGIYSYYGSSPIIANSTIAGNVSSAYGGGICCSDGGSPIIASSTIAGNIASTDGGGIYCSWSTLTVTNTTVAFNSSGVYRTGPNALTLRYDCVYGNGEPSFSGLTDPTGTNGNISADPLFASASAGPDETWGTADDTFGDLRLLPGSPCIDAGNNADVPPDVADLDGDGNVTEPLPLDLAGGARFLDDPQVADTGAGTVPIADIGAFERSRPVGDVDGDWLTDVVDLLYMVDAFGTSSGDPAYDSRCDFNGDGMVDVIDLLDLVYGFGK